MATNGNTKRERLAVLLATGRSIRAAARIAGIAPRTAYRWADDAAFREHVAELRRGMVSRAVACMSATMGKAAAKLRRLLDSEDERVALSAARSILELRTKLQESEELDQRLAVLEAMQSAQSKGSNFR